MFYSKSFERNIYLLDYFIEDYISRVLELCGILLMLRSLSLACDIAWSFYLDGIVGQMRRRKQQKNNNNNNKIHATAKILIFQCGWFECRGMKISIRSYVSIWNAQFFFLIFFVTLPCALSWHHRVIYNLHYMNYKPPYKNTMPTKVFVIGHLQWIFSTLVDMMWNVFTVRVFSSMLSSKE